MALSHVALYGNVSMAREFCKACKGYAFVIDGILQCCDLPSSTDPRTAKRISEPEFVRKQPPASEKMRILLEQDNKCLYCQHSFGSKNERHGKQILLRLVWDHSIPWAYTLNNKSDNFVAACHICNGIKSSHIFKSIEEARIEIEDKRLSKGYKF